ncbi:MAG: sugar transferase [Candidatus Krumholzibacteriia bacterium]|nr:sugar transferase [bacterium]MCB9514400.1 sugar transferase [Candidatus Latescibacterota bacterium]MCB9516663.1 sugar transferase [Candidatus Latescibacterota bacterium]
MKKTVFADDFLESFRSKGRPELSTVIDPEADPTLNWLSRHSDRKHIPNERHLSPLTRRAIRLFDIVASSSALILLSPLFLILATLIKLESRGPVIYRQVRTGLNLRTNDRRRNGNIRVLDERRRNDRRQAPVPGKPFEIYKFRSMVSDAEKNGIQLAKKNDARITRLGKLMRRTRMDELPQFWNVLRGDMSIVGPRPERPEIIAYLEEQIPGYTERLGVKPGITGLAQIRNGYDTDLEHIRRKITLDRYYIQKCSLTNDLKIIVRTLRVVVRGEGAM